MRARSITAPARLAGRRARPRAQMRAAVASIRRFAISGDYARMQERLDAAKVENERRYLQAGGRRWG